MLLWLSLNVHTDLHANIRKYNFPHINYESVNVITRVLEKCRYSVYMGILKIKTFSDDDQTSRTRTLDQIDEGDEEEEEGNIIHGNHSNHSEEENIMHGNHDNHSEEENIIHGNHSEEGGIMHGNHGNHSEEYLQKQTMVRTREMLADKSTKGKQLPIYISFRTVYSGICIETCRK